MLEEARRRLAANGQHGVELRLGEMTHLPLMDGGAGCVVANMVLHHAADPLAVLREIVRVLEPGGSVVLADLARHEREWAREQLADQWLGFEEQELRAWFKSAGLEKVEVARVGAASGQEEVLLVRGVKRAS
jgi:ArsR family transcriptional regulator